MSFSIDQFLKTLNAGFENLMVTYQELDYNGKIPVFFVRCTKLDSLAANWAKLVDAIAFDFQSQLTDEFQIWNIYIFFIRPEGVTDMISYNSLKLKIENDTFSSRKIVVEGQDTAGIINEHILNQNMNFSRDLVAEPNVKFEPDPLLWSILEDKTLKRQKLTGEAGSALEELVKQLKTPRP
ncbi:MAG: ABC-three component system middle component 1 [Chitinophagaceae bacterium]